MSAPKQNNFKRLKSHAKPRHHELRAADAPTSDVKDRLLMGLSNTKRKCSFSQQQYVLWATMLLFGPSHITH